MFAEYLMVKIIIILQIVKIVTLADVDGMEWLSPDETLGPELTKYF